MFESFIRIGRENFRREFLKNCKCMLDGVQMNLGISVRKTQEALIIKIAHKTVNNTIFMLLWLNVNSNCYCGHLRMEKKKKKFYMRKFSEKLCNKIFDSSRADGSSNKLMLVVKVLLQSCRLMLCKVGSKFSPYDR